VCTGCWWGDLRNGVKLEVQHLDGRKTLKCNFKKWEGGAWIGLMWLRIGTGGGGLVNALMNLWVP
jgi:hypothetical protein